MLTKETNKVLGHKILIRKYPQIEFDTKSGEDYSKILEIDPEHIEALELLAFTLAADGQ